MAEIDYTDHWREWESLLAPHDNLRNEVERRATEGGYTELRFNPETMGWAYHRPDEAVGEDGRRYVRVRMP